MEFRNSLTIVIFATLRMQLNKPDSALLILAHGSTENADSSAPTKLQARSIRETGIFGAVHCAFWKEEPSFRQVAPMIEQDEIYVVPNFISEGYFTRQIIPREMELSERTSERNSKYLHYCDPVGIHPSMTDLLLARALALRPDEIPLNDTALIIIGHGTPKNKSSTASIKQQVRALQLLDPGFAEITNAYMEEAPFISDWESIVTSRHVIALPFFISDGLHSYEDIPKMLGIEKLSSDRKNVYLFGKRTLQYSNAIGTDPSMARVIIDQVAYFDEHYRND